jgi:hypothetical protein
MNMWIRQERNCSKTTTCMPWGDKVKPKSTFKFIPVLNQARVYEDVWWNGGIATLFLTSSLFGDEWSASLPGSITPGESAP